MVLLFQFVARDAALVKSEKIRDHIKLCLVDIVIHFFSDCSKVKENQ